VFTAKITVAFPIEEPFPTPAAGIERNGPAGKSKTVSAEDHALPESVSNEVSGCGRAFRVPERWSNIKLSEAIRKRDLQKPLAQITFDVVVDDLSNFIDRFPGENGFCFTRADTLISR
jgi:hypothetical protein